MVRTSVVLRCDAGDATKNNNAMPRSSSAKAGVTLTQPGRKGETLTQPGRKGEAGNQPTRTGEAGNWATHRR
jgi:hypothetical protein